MLMWGGTPRKSGTLTLDLDTDDGRVCERVPMRCSVSIFRRNDTGRIKGISARVLDISSSGALIRAWQPIRIDSYIRIRGNELLTGMAQVRHCTRKGLGFRIGLEFTTALPKRF